MATGKRKRSWSSPTGPPGALESLPGISERQRGRPPPLPGMGAFDLFVPGMDSIPTPRRDTLLSRPCPRTISPRWESNYARDGCSPTEAEAGARVVVVTENMAQGIWGAESALGQCFKLASGNLPVGRWWAWWRRAA